ncbi:MAG: 5,10-methylenetetrahydrofolate reductase [Firmicutes bacterium ADurb.Bin248]|nr:MAG: 5,10-methylenetetrahydrofolate reductase [Firmicutes bacterium ADurb.Bin248]
MELTNLIGGTAPSLSFEVFPPKNSANYESIRAAVEEVASLSPSFISVTYGAGGGTSDYTVSLAADVQDRFRLPVLAHLSCVNATRAGVRAQLDAMRRRGIANVLALRGDMPPGSAPQENWDYRYASELVAEIREYGGFCVGGACYPEGHTESPSQKEDILHLKEKVDAGCAFLTTQMFFENNVYYNFLFKARDAGIRVPIVAGVMPVTNASQIRRIVALSGTALPQRFRYILDRFGANPATMRQAGIAYATEQIVDLFANGVQAVHVYSMNNAFVARKIKENLSEILK